MRNRIARLALVLLASAASAEPGSDAPGPESAPSPELAPHYIAVLGSFVGPDPGRDTRSKGYGGTFLYGAHLDGPFWLEGRLQAALFETGDHAGTDFYHYGGGIDGVVTLGDRTGFTPFALLGVGGVYDDVQPDRDDSFNLRADLGLGFVTAPLTARGLKMRGEGRGIFDSFESGQFDWQVSLGIEIPLGYREVVERVVVREVVREVAVREPSDSDLDGVPDRFDQCPNTIAGGRVDATGCLIREQTVVLDNIHFDHDSSRLTPESERKLDEVAASLREEPDARFEIAGHTDSTGSDDYNDRLSQARALSVLRYLAGRGIDGERMSARGYGERQPIDTNETQEGRSRNRRVEFRFHARGSE